MSKAEGVGLVNLACLLLDLFSVSSYLDLFQRVFLFGSFLVMSLQHVHSFRGSVTA